MWVIDKILSVQKEIYSITSNLNRETEWNNPMTENLNWGEYSYLTDEISNAQAATVKITRSTAVMISDQYALTAAHSPLDANNEITPNLEVKNIWGEVRDITDVYYDVSADFAIV